MPNPASFDVISPAPPLLTFLECNWNSGGMVNQPSMDSPPNTLSCSWAKNYTLPHTLIAWLRLGSEPPYSSVPPVSERGNLPNHLCPWPMDHMEHMELESLESQMPLGDLGVVIFHVMEPLQQGITWPEGKWTFWGVTTKRVDHPADCPSLFCNSALSPLLFWLLDSLKTIITC